MLGAAKALPVAEIGVSVTFDEPTSPAPEPLPVAALLEPSYTARDGQAEPALTSVHSGRRTKGAAR